LSFLLLLDPLTILAMLFLGDDDGEDDDEDDVMFGVDDATGCVMASIVLAI
jgi:hypothetical protein